MRYYYGRALIGQKAVIKKPVLKSRNISLIAIVNKAKLYQYYVLKTPCNKITFEDLLNEFFYHAQTRSK